MSLPHNPAHFPRMKHRAAKRQPRTVDIGPYDPDTAFARWCRDNLPTSRGVGIDYIVWDEPVFYPPSTEEASR